MIVKLKIKEIKEIKEIREQLKIALQELSEGRF